VRQKLLAYDSKQYEDSGYRSASVRAPALISLVCAIEHNWPAQPTPIDFAVSERNGRFQIGVAGYFAFQVEDDRQSGVSVPPDGRRLEALTLGGVLAYDMPEHNASLKIKFLTTVIEHNAVRSPGVAFGWV
jgi:hypothetical protein